MKLMRKIKQQGIDSEVASECKKVLGQEEAYHPIIKDISAADGQVKNELQPWSESNRGRIKVLEM